MLKNLGLTFELDVADIDETPSPGEAPSGYVERVAREKAAAVRARRPEAAILAADTIVVVDGDILGKPKDGPDAEKMLTRLSGRTHEVLSAVVLATPKGVEARRAVTEVEFRPLTAAEIAWYVATGEPKDKSGSYAHQGIGAFMVRRLVGASSNVTGLPLEPTLELLQRAGVRLPWTR
jgi:septum formation protein